jgi:hypothetical protein
MQCADDGYQWGFFFPSNLWCKLGWWSFTRGLKPQIWLEVRERIVEKIRIPPTFMATCWNLTSNYGYFRMFFFLIMALAMAQQQAKSCKGHCWKAVVDPVPCIHYRISRPKNCILVLNFTTNSNLDLWRYY